MINIVQAPRASTPYPWAKFAQWMNEAGLNANEFQTLLENGAEPTVTAAVGCAFDEDVVYPGLPSIEGLTLDPEPGVNIRGGELR